MPANQGGDAMTEQATGNARASDPTFGAYARRLLFDTDGPVP